MSRKIDKLVAEHIFGLKEGMIPGYSAPHYSTEIEAAWKIIDLFNNESGFMQEVVTYGKRHWCVLRSMEVTGNASTNISAPLAICLAALKAKNIDVEGPVDDV